MNTTKNIAMRSKMIKLCTTTICYKILQNGVPHHKPYTPYSPLAFQAFNTINKCTVPKSAEDTKHQVERLSCNLPTKVAVKHS
jgi:hypothetical protein